ncbi:DUF3347 domain-containing protein [Mucilaginibacter calamicampi]|uniref:DUF3347 domain-containing protein n=1 Tax=Mucilaginibacter calamicampi TaxID=1302352 RepID=A0ABW2YU24_9SPHI
MKPGKLYFLLMAFVVFVSTAKAQDKSFNGVLTAYFAVKNDLAADNLAATKTHTAELATAIKAVPADKIPAEQLATWKRIQLSATRIGEAKDIDGQRDYFAILSDNIIIAAKALKANAAPVYQQYCPMKKVNWLSETAAIKNPFYGKTMLTCGQVTETLAAVK